MQDTKQLNRNSNAQTYQYQYTSWMLNTVGELTRLHEPVVKTSMSLPLSLSLRQPELGIETSTPLALQLSPSQMLLPASSVSRSLVIPGQSCCTMINTEKSDGSVTYTCKTRTWRLWLTQLQDQVGGSDIWTFNEAALHLRAAWGHIGAKTQCHHQIEYV